MDKYARDWNEIYSDDELAWAVILTLDSLANISTSKASRPKDHRLRDTQTHTYKPTGYYQASRLCVVSAQCCWAVLEVQLWVSPLRFDYLHPHWLLGPAVKHINEISPSLGGKLTTLAGWLVGWLAGLWWRELEKMKAEGMEEEREGFDTVSHFVESYFIMGHCVPLASIRLFGHTHTRAHTHTCTHLLTMCKIHGRTYRSSFVFPCSVCAEEETTMPQAAALRIALKSA